MTQSRWRALVALAETGSVRAAAAGELAPERGRLRLAAVTTAGEHVLPRLLAAFRRRYPRVDLVLEVAPSVAGRRGPSAPPTGGGAAGPPCLGLGA